MIKSEEYRDLSEARTIRAARTILKVCEKRRDEKRVLAEAKPKISDDITKDIRYQLGYIQCANDILDLPRQAETTIQSNVGKEN